MKTLFSILFLAGSTLLAQTPIQLNNPSFESKPSQGLAPEEWEACGFEGETPPDVQPSNSINYFFGVTQIAYHGDTYLGMVVRDNDTWESVTQVLNTPLKKGVEYKFSLFLCRSGQYDSQSRLTFREANYTTPALLRIWGGNGPCPAEQLLAQTDPVEHEDFRQYLFTFTPDEDWNGIRLEAYFNETEAWPYNGNLLVDHCSALVPPGFPLPISKGARTIVAGSDAPRTAPERASSAAKTAARTPVKHSNFKGGVPARTQPVFTAAELYAMDAAQLENYLVWWFQQPKPLTPYGGVVFNAWKFEKAVAEKGLVAVIEGLDFSEFGALVGDLETIGMEKTLELVEQIGRISRKPESLRKADEQALYLGADDIFSDNEIGEPVSKKRHEYIDLHRDRLIMELTK